MCVDLSVPKIGFSRVTAWPGPSSTGLAGATAFSRALGMGRMTENEKLLCAMFAGGLIEREDVPPSCWHRPRKPKPLSLAIAIRQAKKKGMDLTVAPDGSMTFKNVGSDNVTTLQGNGAATAEDELAQWRKRKGYAHSG